MTNDASKEKCRFEEAAGTLAGLYARCWSHCPTPSASYFCWGEGVRPSVCFWHTDVHPMITCECVSMHCVFVVYIFWLRLFARTSREHPDFWLSLSWGNLRLPAKHLIFNRRSCYWSWTQWKWLSGLLIWAALLVYRLTCSLPFRSGQKMMKMTRMRTRMLQMSLLRHRWTCRGPAFSCQSKNCHDHQSKAILY